MSVVKISGFDWKIEEVSLTTAYADVTLTGVVRSFVLQNRGDEDVKFRRSATDTGEWTIKAGSTLSIDVEMGDVGDASITVGQAKVVSGTATLEVLAVR